MTTTRGSVSPAQVALTLLSVFRLTRLVTQDYLTDDLRKRLQARLPEKPAYLIGCPWCASFWIAPPLVTLVTLFPHSRLVNAVLLSLAASATTGLIAKLDAAEDFGVTLTVVDDK